MISRPALRRSLAVVAILTVVGGAAIGCTPKAAPTPTPTAMFANEEDAFAAAEKVYREYNDAGNREREGDADADSKSFLVGEALEDEINSARELIDAGIELAGDIVVLNVFGIEADLGSEPVTVTSRACLDIGDVRATDESGKDVTTAGRSDVYGVDLSFVESDGALKIVRFEVSGEIAC